MAAFTAIDDAGLYYKTIRYVGNDTSARAITGVGFQPDFTWIKNMDATDSSILTDSVRGATETLISDTTAAQATEAEALQAFGTDGYTIGDLAAINTTGEDFVSWNWKAGTTTGIDTTGSDITPTSYSFNQDVGFSIVQYEGNATGGALLPHGLGVVPEFAIFKSIDDTPNWRVYHKDTDATAPEDYALIMNTTGVRDNDNTAWNDTAPTSVLMCLGSSPTTNDGSTMIAYFFAGKSGYSKFGIYYGNGNTNGTYVYTGFRPARIFTKDYATTGNWNIWDDKRDGFNVKNIGLTANQNAAQFNITTEYVDILSNGFKWVSASQGNEPGQPYIWAAFAQSPFVNSNGVPTTAR